MQNAVFENTTQYDATTLDSLNETVGRIVRKQTFLVRKTAMLAVGIGCILLGVYLLVSKTQETLGIILILVGMAAGVKGVLFRKLKVWGGPPSLECGGEERHFLFLEEGIQVKKPNGSKTGCLYGDIMLHSETETYFLLMQNFQTGFLVRKDGFTVGTVDEFRKFLVKKTACRQFEIANDPNN